MGGCFETKSEMAASTLFLFVVMMMTINIECMAFNNTMIPMERAAKHCPHGWTLFYRESLCYKFFPGKRSYYSAKHLCKQQGDPRLTLLLLQTLQETTSLPPFFQNNIFGLVDIGSKEAAIHFVGTIIPDGPIQTGDNIHIRNQTIIVE